MRNFKALMISTVFGGLALTSSAFAATQGSEGETSTATADITVTIPKLVKITDVSNLAGGTYNGGASGFNMNDNVCIYSNMAASGKYTVKVTSTNPSTSPTAGFYVGQSGTTEEILFTLAWNDVQGTTGEAALTENTNLPTQDGFSDQPDCGASTNANFHAVMTQADMLAVLPGAYSATITILITPE